MIKELKHVVIYGEVNNLHFEKPLAFYYDPKKESVEEAIIKEFDSKAYDFNSLSVEKGWRGAFWTYELNYSCFLEKSF